jgi:hypothetical protein
MATKKHSSRPPDQLHGGDPISPEERRLLMAYRAINSRWEKNAIFLLVQSVGEGGFTYVTNKYSWKKMSETIGLTKTTKAVRHV